MIAGLEILNLHAQGGMAEVYRARGQGADGRLWQYAVKRILPELTQDLELRKMFVEEARVASMLVHPNIVRVYDLARSESDDFFIVMEFLEGRDLSEAIDKADEQQRKLPVWLAIHVAREILSALTYATTQATDREGRPLALIHRDISPHNIFLGFDGQVKLTDFGVAKVAQSNVHTQVGVTKGKFGYMSPEQLNSDPLDFRSDLYNVGILLYESLTGRKLFHGENPSQFLQAMIRNEVPPLEPALRVPAELEALMRRALSREREGRPPNAAAFDAELAAIAARYNLTATRAHLAQELKVLFGAEIESCPVPQPHYEAPKVLASVDVAQPNVVRRVPTVVPLPKEPTLNPPLPSLVARPLSGALPTPDAGAPNAGVPDAGAGARPRPERPETQPKRGHGQNPSSLEQTPVRQGSKPAVNAGAPSQRPPTRTDAPPSRPAWQPTAAASKTPSQPLARPGTRQVRALDDAENDSATLPPDHPALAQLKDPSTLPPDSMNTEAPPPSPTVIGRGTRAIALSQDDWADATDAVDRDESPKKGVVTRGSKVLPLSTKKK